MWNEIDKNKYILFNMNLMKWKWKGNVIQISNSINSNDIIYDKAWYVFEIIPSEL